MWEDRVKPEREGRLARRLPMGIRVILESVENTGPIEVTHTENVGPQGARLVTQHPRRAREPVLFLVSRTSLRIRAQVIYCVPRRDGKFEIGVRWNSPPVNWTDMPPEAHAS
jgi:hypothetical protein